MEKYFIVNTGSASKKYALYAGKKKLFFAHLEKEKGNFVMTIVDRAKTKKMAISRQNFIHSIKYLVQLLISQKVIADKKEIIGIGMRIVAPGTYFQKHRRIDENYFIKLNKEKSEAPLHLIPIIEEIKAIRKVFPGAPLIGVSDSAFHSSLPDHSRLYALPTAIAGKLDIRRFGFHGISLQSLLKKIKILFGEAPARIIICHLGSGSSITAIKNGKSLDTSMGFTPLEGLPMGTRVGDIDAGAVIYLAQKNKLNFNQLEKYLNSSCGFLGLSGKTGDVRELLDLEKRNNKKAALALETFVYKIQKYIGAYIAALNGLDLLVFSATIGERSFIMRSRICRNLDQLGILLDEKKNTWAVSRDGFINKKSARVKIVVLTTDEMEEIANQTIKIL
ncbi:MAG: acetate/propionate family kinase [bacterium]|nr:acetate/propionate family kinase [bacterium]